MGDFVIKIYQFWATNLSKETVIRKFTREMEEIEMNRRVTSEEVAIQLAKSIQLLLEWTRQEISTASQIRINKPDVEKERIAPPNLVPPEKLLTAGEVAEILQVSNSKVYYLMQTAEIPTIRFGRSVRVRHSDLDEYIKKSRVEKVV